MIPKLYSKSTPLTISNFSSNGLGGLNDCLSCICIEERNGDYTLEITYPIYGNHYADFENEAFIKAKPNQIDDEQIFRIYYISKLIDGVINVKAEHISAMLRDLPCLRISVAENQTTNNLAKALAMISTAGQTNPFNFVANKITTSKILSDVPCSVSEFLKICNLVVKSEVYFNNFNVYIGDDRGSNRGFNIKYGKNMTDFNAEIDVSEVVTGVYPYCIINDVYHELTTKTIIKSNTLKSNRIVCVDLSSEIEGDYTEAKLTTAGNNWLNENCLITQKINLDVSFINLGDSIEYSQFKDIYKIGMSDTVNVYFEDYGISATAKVIKTEYDVMLEKYKSIEIGNKKTKLSKIIGKVI